MIVHLFFRKTAGRRRRRYVKLGGRKRRVRRYRIWTFKVGGKVFRIHRMRRRLYARFKRKYVRVKRKRKTWKIRVRNRWCRLRRRGRSWRYRYRKSWRRLGRFRLRLRIGRRYKKIKRVRKRWRLFAKKRWRPVMCGIRRFITYKSKRVWLKRRRGKWKARLRKRWRNIKLRKYLENIMISSILREFYGISLLPLGL